MSADYRIDIKTTAGVKVAEINDVLALSFTQIVNDVGICEFVISRYDEAAPYIIDKYQVEIWRRWPEQGIDWYRAFDAILRDDIPLTTDDDIPQVIVRSFGTLHLLGWRCNLYASETANRTKFTSAKPETIVKTLVQYNCTSSGTTAAGRDRDATYTGALNGFTVTIETDSARGVALDYQSARGNVLAELQAVQQACVATATPFDFDLVKQSGSTYQFQFKTPYLGTDRSTGASAVVFSEAFRNMRAPRLERIRSQEQSAIVVGGGGTGGDRTILGVGGPNFHLDTNDIERFYNGATTTEGTTNAAILQTLGQKEADARAMRPQLRFDVLQQTVLLGRDYFLGDVVSCRFNDETFVQQVWRVTSMWRPDGAEAIQVELRDL